MAFEQEDHVTETSFEDYVEHQIAERVGEENVERQYYFENGRIADFLVFNERTDSMEVWELENDAGSLISGTGQVLFYRQSALDEYPDGGSCVPVLAFPEDHIDEKERGIYEAIGVQLREITVPDDVSTEGV